MIRVSFYFLLLFILLFSSPFTQADCSSPTGLTGAYEWISGSGEMKFCNGTNWVSTKVSTSLTACSTAGRVLYTAGDLKYCDGSLLVSTTSGLTNGSCAGTTAGTFHYNTTNNWEEWCDGTLWNVMYIQPSFSLDFMS